MPRALKLTPSAAQSGFLGRINWPLLKKNTVDIKLSLALKDTSHDRSTLPLPQNIKCMADGKVLGVLITESEGAYVSLAWFSLSPVVQPVNRSTPLNSQLKEPPLILIRSRC